MSQYLTEANASTIATTGGIKAIASAMTNHANNNDIQKEGSAAINNVVYDSPAHIAMAGEAGVVPLLQHAAAMGVDDATNQLKRMGL